MFDFSPIQIILVLGIALLVLGPKRLPAMARSLGHGLRGFRDSLAGDDEPDNRVDEPKLAVVAPDAADEQEALTRPQPVESTEDFPGEQSLTRLQAVEHAPSAG